MEKNRKKNCKMVSKNIIQNFLSFCKFSDMRAAPIGKQALRPWLGAFPHIHCLLVAIVHQTEIAEKVCWYSTSDSNRNWYGFEPSPSANWGSGAYYCGLGFQPHGSCHLGLSSTSYIYSRLGPISFVQLSIRQVVLWHTTRTVLFRLSTKVVTWPIWVGACTHLLTTLISPCGQ